MDAGAGTKTSVPTAVLIVAAILGAAGCASFAGNQLPRIEPAAVALSGPLEPIPFELDASAIGMDSERLHERIVEGLLETSPGLFIEGKEIQASDPLHLELRFENKGDVGTAMVSGFITGLSLFVIPGVARDEYRLEARLISEGRILREYAYDDYMDTWMQILLIFVAPFRFPSAVANETVDNMLLTFAHDLREDWPHVQGDPPEDQVGTEPPPVRTTAAPRNEIESTSGRESVRRVLTDSGQEGETMARMMKASSAAGAVAPRRGSSSP